MSSLKISGPIQRFGATAVPFTVSWTGEVGLYVGICPYFKRPAICQDVAPGVGRPLFGKPHSLRQRQAIVQGRCDLCARPLKDRTKVSLSHARTRSNAAQGLANLQVEPLLHRECALESMKYCPSLRKDISEGAIQIRQVTRWQVQVAIMSPEYVSVYVPSYELRVGGRILGHTKVELQRWKDRDMAWLERGVA